MRYLRTNTAVRITVGPFLDKSDGITPETALTATNEKLTLVVDDSNVPTLVIDANATASGGNNDFVHITGDDAGFYDLELTAAQTNYLGRAMLSITYATDHCPVFHEFMILPAMIYDSFVLGTDRLDTNVTHIGDTSQTARDIGASVLLSSGTGTGQLKLASGYVAMTWADIASPTTTQNLSGTTIKTATDVETDTADIQSRIPAALGANGNIKADVRDYSGTAGTFSGGRPDVNTTHIAGTAWASTTLFTLASHDPGATIGTSTLTQTQVTGGAYALNSASFAFNAALDLTTTQKASVNTEADTALVDINLDHLFAVAITTGDVIDNSFAAKITSKSATASYASFVNTTDSFQAIRDGLINAASMGDNYVGNGFISTRAQGVPAPETIGSTGNTTTTVHVPNWVFGDDEINDMLIIVYDNDQGEYHSRWIDDWVNSTKLVTVATLPFTPENAVDIVYLYPNRRNALALSQSFPSNFASLGINASGHVSRVTLTDTLTTYTGNTPQTGDAYARLGAPAGASVSADVAAVKTDTGNLVTRITSSLFTGITSMAQWLGLLAGKQTGNSTARTEIRATGGGSGTYDETTDSQEALRDRGDAAWVTATGFSTHTAADVWAVATRVLTAGTNIVLAKGTGVTGFTDLSAAQVNAEVDTALADYDGPTNAEMVARTIVSASYATSAAQTTAQNDLDILTGSDGVTLATSQPNYAPAAATALASLVTTVGAAGAGLTAAGITAAGVRSAIGLASANLDTQLDALPTNAELATALGTADDATLAAIAALNNISTSQVTTSVTTALTTAVAEGYRSTNATGSIRDILYEILAVLTQADISGVTMTTRKLDGTTVAKTYTLSDASVPTSITEAT